MALGATELEICSAFNFFLAIVSCRRSLCDLIGTGIGFSVYGLAFNTLLHTQTIRIKASCF